MCKRAARDFPLLPSRHQQFFHYRFLVLGAVQDCLLLLVFRSRLRFFLACCTGRRQDPFLFLILSPECFSPVAVCKARFFSSPQMLHSWSSNSFFGTPALVSVFQSLVCCSVSEPAPGVCVSRAALLVSPSDPGFKFA
jgi:hypothetical protein